MRALGQAPAQTVELPVRAIQQAINVEGRPVMVTGTWDTITNGAWQGLVQSLGLIPELAIRDTVAIVGSETAQRVLGIANRPAAGQSVTILQLAQELMNVVEMKEQVNRLPFWTRLKFRGLFTAWARSIEATIKGLSADLEEHPNILRAIAAAINSTPEQVISSMRQPLIAKGNGLSAAPVVIAIGIIAAALVALGALVVIGLNVDTIRDVLTQRQQTSCVQMILEATAHGVATEQVMRELPEVCRPASSGMSTTGWLVAGGISIVVVGLGWWWYRREQRRN